MPKNSEKLKDTKLKDSMASKDFKSNSSKNNGAGDDNIIKKSEEKPLSPKKPAREMTLDQQTRSDDQSKVGNANFAIAGGAQQKEEVDEEADEEVDDEADEEAWSGWNINVSLQFLA